MCVCVPKIIVVNDDPIFKGFFLQLFEFLGILVKAVLKGNHRAVRNEIFHKYLNKVQVLHAADKASVAQWRLGTSFATYSWNAAPVDGTDIERAVVAIGRSFPFPIDIAQAQPSTEGGSEHEAADHADAWYPVHKADRKSCFMYRVMIPCT